MLSDLMLPYGLNEAETKALKAETSYFKEVRKIEALQIRINKMAQKANRLKFYYENLLFIACKSR